MVPHPWVLRGYPFTPGLDVSSPVWVGAFHPVGIGPAATGQAAHAPHEDGRPRQCQEQEGVLESIALPFGRCVVFMSLTAQIFGLIGCMLLSSPVQGWNLDKSTCMTVDFPRIIVNSGSLEMWVSPLDSRTLPPSDSWCDHSPFVNNPCLLLPSLSGRMVICDQMIRAGLTGDIGIK